MPTVGFHVEFETGSSCVGSSCSRQVWEAMPQVGYFSYMFCEPLHATSFFLIQAKHSCELMHSSWSIHMMDWEPALGKKLSLGQASSDESKRIFNSNFLVHFPSVVGKSYQRDKLRGNEVTRCSIKISMRHHHPVTFSIVILPNCKTSFDGFKGRFFCFFAFLRKSFVVNWRAMFGIHKIVLILTSI